MEISKQKELSPFASWFLAYADENQLNLADLALSRSVSGIVLLQEDSK